MTEPQKTWIEELVAEQRAAGRRWYAFEPKDSAAGRRLMAAGPEEQRDFVLAAMKRLDHRGRIKSLLDYEAWAIARLCKRCSGAGFRSRTTTSCPCSSGQSGSRTLRVRYAADDQGPPGLPEGARATPALQERPAGSPKIWSPATPQQRRRWATRLKELGDCRARPYRSSAARRGPTRR